MPIPSNWGRVIRIMTSPRWRRLASLRRALPGSTPRCFPLRVGTEVCRSLSKSFDAVHDPQPIADARDTHFPQCDVIQLQENVTADVILLEDRDVIGALDIAKPACDMGVGPGTYIIAVRDAWRRFVVLLPAGGGWEGGSLTADAATA